MLDPATYGSIHSLSCVALIVDINGSKHLFRSFGANLVGQFVRDILIGSIGAIEQANGSIISFTGDGLIAVLPDEDAAAIACYGIAHDFRKTNDYLDANNRMKTWPFLHDDFGLKIALERGPLEVHTVGSEFLGAQPFIVGEPVIYANRLLSYGKGNRCLIGPRSAVNWKYGELSGPFTEPGKHKDLQYEYYLFDLEDFWID